MDEYAEDSEAPMTFKEFKTLSPGKLPTRKLATLDGSRVTMNCTRR